MEVIGVAPEVWFPVVSVVIGFVCKGVLDHLTDHRRFKADDVARREERSEAARLRKIEFQRKALIELQELLERLGRLNAKALIEDTKAYKEKGVWGKNLLEKSLDEDLRQTQSRVMVVGSRIAHDQIRHKSTQFRDCVTRITLAKEQYEAEVALNDMVDISKCLHELIGEELRRLDSSEEDILT